MEGRSIRALKEKAIEMGFNVEVLPSGAILLVRNNEAEIQILSVLDAYYVKYIRTGRAFVIYNLDNEVIEAIFNNRLTELKDRDIVEIPPY
ncbi:MAG: hypothetical protein JHC26_05540 [Thermofilum sp.]|jgi:hypothetical protein|uniref:hypothetical protein n=1 Tax=Thermofilum sp. TaxID=1961369 RepID=UPI00258C1A6D|nr:hypothetical protein [Thermofilum sp.]MCI4408534.1 hypothetical protein [Thermofilum sp.]